MFIIIKYTKITMTSLPSENIHITSIQVDESQVLTNYCELLIALEAQEDEEDAEYEHTLTPHQRQFKKNTLSRIGQINCSTDLIHAFNDYYRLERLEKRMSLILRQLNELERKKHSEILDVGLIEDEIRIKHTLFLQIDHSIIGLKHKCYD
jgi:hypothetical protein